MLTEFASATVTPENDPTGIQPAIMRIAGDDAKAAIKAVGATRVYIIDGTDSKNTPGSLKKDVSIIANSYILGGTSVTPEAFEAEIKGLLKLHFASISKAANLKTTSLWGFSPGGFVFVSHFLNHVQIAKIFVKWQS